MKEKILRDTHFRSMHEMGELKRAQELRVDESSVEMQEQMNCINDSGNFKKWNRITAGDCLTFPVNQQGFEVHALC